MINVQKSYSVHIGPILSNSVIFGQLGPFCSLWSYSVYSVQFDPLQSYSSHSVDFGSIWSILSTLVLFGPFCPLWSYSVHVAIISSTSFRPVHVSPIRSSLSTSILFGLIWSHLVYSVHFGPFILFRSYFVYLVHFVPFGQFISLQFILIPFDLFLCSYIMGQDMFGLKTLNLNPNLLIKIIISNFHQLFLCTTFTNFLSPSQRFKLH